MPRGGMRPSNELPPCLSERVDLAFCRFDPPVKESPKPEVHKQAVGMNPRHLSAVRASELRNHFYNELGAIKLAVIWMSEHFGDANR